MPTPYGKPWLSYTDQLQLLKSRGLIVTDESLATEHLERIGYYRFSGYLYPFRKTEWDQNNYCLVVKDDFKTGTTFEIVSDLYVFDKNLRLILLDALERIEISLRAKFAYILGKYDPIAHLNPTFFNHNIPRFNHQETVNKINKMVAESKIACITWNKRKYGSQIPIWVSCQIWDFGTINKLYLGLKPHYQKEISLQFGIKNPSTFNSWIFSLNYLRNICAHHSRLWNLNMVINPKFKGSLFDSHIPTISKRCFEHCLVANYFVNKICPRSEWSNRFMKTIEQFPDFSSIEFSNRESTDSITLKAAGFPSNWKSLWAIK